MRGVRHGVPRRASPAGGGALASFLAPFDRIMRGWSVCFANGCEGWEEGGGEEVARVTRFLEAFPFSVVLGGVSIALFQRLRHGV